MHGVKSVAGMLPEGVAPWRGRMGDELVVTLNQPGVYGVKCPAGYKVGMVGLIVVGRDPPNWESARAVRHPPEPSRAFAGLFERGRVPAGAPGGLPGLALQPQWRPLAPTATVSSPSARLIADHRADRAELTAGLVEGAARRPPSGSGARARNRGGRTAGT